MSVSYLKASASALMFIALAPLAATAQGFDSGSFEDLGGETSGETPGAAQAPADDGFIDQGSFTENGSSSQGSLAPPPPPPPDGGGASVIPPPPPANTDSQGGATPPPPPDSGGQGGVAPPPPDGQPPGPQLDPQITAFEMRDFGVPPQQTLRQDQFHAHTPTSIPGANLVSTANLVQAMNSGTQMVVIDVLGSGYGLPNAYVAPALSSPGSFDDRTQQQAVQWLNQITGGNRQVPIVIYCSDPMCWLSYNASLRTAAAGYSNVYWYRGGLAAWEMAALPLRPTGF